MIFKWPLSFAFSLLLTLVNAQESIHHISNSYFFPDEIENNQERLFGIALSELEQEKDIDHSILNIAINSFELDEDRSIDLLLESINRSSDSREANANLIAIANKLFDQSEYTEAEKYYTLIDDSGLKDDLAQEINFKRGYIALLDKNFSNSKIYLVQANEFSGAYDADISYYLGISHYFLEEKEDAILSLQKVQNHKRYGEMVPFYLTQIYFKDENYIKVVNMELNNSANQK